MMRTAHVADGKCVWIVDDLLDTQSVHQVHQGILAAPVSLLGCSNEDTAKHLEVMFDLDPKDFETSQLGQAIRVALRRTGITGTCTRVLGNSMRFGAFTFVHQDASQTDDVLSVLYCVNSEWDPNWGGELLFFNQDLEATACVSYRPGRAILFPANLFHRANVPYRQCTETRFSLSIRYRLSSR